MYWMGLRCTLAAGRSWPGARSQSRSPSLARNVLNYLLSITNVQFQTYALASFLAIVPYLVLFVRFDSDGGRPSL